MRIHYLVRCLLAVALGLATALLSACGGSGKGLIPLANAGPLQSDFNAITQAAEAGGGNCAATTRAIEKAQHDYEALPSSVNQGLHSRLSEGLSNLRARALELCEQPIVPSGSTSTQTTTNTQTTQTSTTTTQTTPTITTTTQTTPPEPTTTSATPPPPGGGTQAPGESSPPSSEQEGASPSPSGGSSGGTGQGAGQ